MSAVRQLGGPFQGHVIRSFSGGSWLSVDATYFAGGRTTFNGVLKADLQQNWRAGVTYGFPSTGRTR